MAQPNGPTCTQNDKAWGDRFGMFSMKAKRNLTNSWMKISVTTLDKVYDIRVINNKREAKARHAHVRVSLGQVELFLRKKHQVYFIFHFAHICVDQSDIFNYIDNEWIMEPNHTTNVIHDNPMDLLHWIKCHNAPVLCPRMHHCVPQICMYSYFGYKMMHCGIYENGPLSLPRLKLAKH